MPPQNLHQGIISIKSNYASARTVENTRTFYNKVILRLHSEYSNRLLSVNVFATGSLQIAGIKDTEELPRVKERLSEIINSCTGSISPQDIHRHPVYGFHLHGEVIFGVPLSRADTGESNELWPIGVFREDINCAFIHDTEMVLCQIGGQRIFSPTYRRRRNPLAGCFDFLGRPVDVAHLPPNFKDDDEISYSYNFSASNLPVRASMWTHTISMMNAGFHYGKRVDLKKLSAVMRLEGFFVSYDPNVYRDINAKFKQGNTFIGTALITSSGYVRLYGFKEKSAIERATVVIQNMMAPLILVQ